MLTNWQYFSNAITRKSKNLIRKGFFNLSWSQTRKFKKLLTLYDMKHALHLWYTFFYEQPSC